MLALDPWNASPINENNPTGPVRQLAFGPNGHEMLTVLILEAQIRVDVLRLTWAETTDPE